MTYTPNPCPRIAIVGGGPGGLTLGRLLQHNQIPCTIYEVDGSRHTRQSQGGTLDIHAESGQEALRQAGLHSEFKKHMRSEGAAMRISNKQGQVLLDSAGGPTGEEEGRPEIDRLVLRNILLDSIDLGTIKWGKKVSRIEPTPDGNGLIYQIHFEDGGVEGPFDLVVGADGAWSKVRPLLTDAKPFYSGTTFVEGRIHDIDSRYPELSKAVGPGSAWTLGDKKGLLAQRNGDGSVRTAVMLRVDEGWSNTCGIDFGRDDAKERLIELEFGDWSQQAKDLFLKCGHELAVRPLYMLPIGVKWDCRQGVTLIGDAAHLMTPFAGVGVNLAMNDALDLANAIKAYIVEGGSLEEHQQKFEAQMQTRGQDFAQQSWNNMKLMLLSDTAEGIVEGMRIVMSGGTIPDVETN